MDLRRFDSAIRQLDSGESRRRLLGLLGGSALGGLFAVGLANESDAKKHKKKKKKCKNCGECRVCQKGKCTPKPDGTECTNGTCDGGVCRTLSNCPAAQVCEFSETCCTVGINSADDVSFCGDNQQEICTCPAGDDFCAGAAGSQCCLSGDDCEQTQIGEGVCVTDTCSAGNGVCNMEWAACGETCNCVTTTADANLCADFSTFEGCPDTSECSTDANCSGDDVCVNVGCRCGGGTLGACLPPCPDEFQRARAGKAGRRRARLPLGPLA